VRRSYLRVDDEAKTIRLELEIDTEAASVMEYFEIFALRMIMCRKSADFLGCRPPIHQWPRSVVSTIYHPMTCFCHAERSRAVHRFWLGRRNRFVNRSAGVRDARGRQGRPVEFVSREHKIAFTPPAEGAKVLRRSQGTESVGYIDHSTGAAFAPTCSVVEPPDATVR
jgi:hypothetical protein